MYQNLMEKKLKMAAAFKVEVLRKSIMYKKLISVEGVDLSNVLQSTFQETDAAKQLTFKNFRGIYKMNFSPERLGS